MTKSPATQFIDALNRIDELASMQAMDNHDGEAEQLENDYNLLYSLFTDMLIEERV